MHQHIIFNWQLFLINNLCLVFHPAKSRLERDNYVIFSGDVFLLYKASPFPEKIAAFRKTLQKTAGKVC